MTQERIVDYLTPEEVAQLEAEVKGYGNLKRVAKQAGVYYDTLRNVVNSGRGEQTTLTKLRNTILSSPPVPA